MQSQQIIIVPFLSLLPSTNTFWSPNFIRPLLQPSRSSGLSVYLEREFFAHFKFGIISLDGMRGGLGSALWPALKSFIIARGSFDGHHTTRLYGRLGSFTDKAGLRL